MTLNGVSFSDTDFFQQQREFERGWIKPIGIALVIHFLTFAASAILPEILSRKPILDDVVTVNLVSLPDVNEAVPEQKAPPVQKAPEPKQEAVKKPEPAKTEVAIVKPPAPVLETSEPVKPISLTPLKRKEKKIDQKKLDEERARRLQEQENKKALAQARLEEEKARLAAEEARAALAEMIRQRGVQQTASAAKRSSGGKEVQSIVFKQYLSALYDKVQRLWVLPDMRQWDASLETIVVLRILRDGTVTQTTIEKKSKDPFFDQFVMKTVQSALPMPRFPSLMPQESVEVGFRFRPGELVNY